MRTSRRDFLRAALGPAAVAVALPFLGACLETEKLPDVVEKEYLPGGRVYVVCCDNGSDGNLDSVDYVCVGQNNTIERYPIPEGHRTFNNCQIRYARTFEENRGAFTPGKDSVTIFYRDDTTEATFYDYDADRLLERIDVAGKDGMMQQIPKDSTQYRKYQEDFLKALKNFVADK